MGTWHVIESLVPGVETVISTDGKRRDWASTRRLQPAGANDVRIDSIIAAARAAGEPQDVTTTSKRSGTVVKTRAIPVIGPSGDAHGVQLWVGSPDEEPGEPRPCSGVAWLLDEFMIHQTLDSSLMSGVDPKEWDPVATPAEYIRRSVQFDDELEFVSMALEPTPGRSMNTQFSVRHDTGRIMQWQVVLRTTPDPTQRGWRVLFQDVSDVYPASKPTLAQVGLTDGLRGIGYHVALFESRNGHLGLWISPAAEWMEWQFAHLTGPVIDPADLPLFREATDKLAQGGTEEFVTIGLRTREMTYAKSAVRISPFQRENHDVDQHMVLVQISSRQTAGPFD